MLSKIKANIQALFKNELILGLVCALVLWLIHGQIFTTYIHLPFVSGLDAPGHSATGEYYAYHIFPKTWGWIPYWFGGMPFPQFYPPLFYFTVALLSKIFFFASYKIVFKVFLIVLFLTTPSLMIWLSKKIFTHRSLYTKLAVGGLTTLLLSTHGIISKFGFTIDTTIGNGFIPQFFSLFPLVAFTAFLPTVLEQKRSRYLATLFLWMVLLSNVHVVAVGVIYLSVFGVYYAITSPNAKSGWLALRTYALVGIVALLGASFWYIPLISTYTFFTTRSLIFDKTDLLHTGWSFALLAIPIALLFTFKHKHHAIIPFSLATLIIPLCALLPLQKAFPFIPFHFYRWIAFIFYASIITLTYCVDSLSPKLKSTWLQLLLVLLMIGGFYVMDYKFIHRPITVGLYQTFIQDNGPAMFEYLSNAHIQNLIVEQLRQPARSASFTFDSELALLNVPVATHILRESSISNLFFTPVRNSFSEGAEMASMKTFLGFDQSFLKQPLAARLKRAKDMGISHLLVTSSKMVENLIIQKNFVELEKDFGTWKLFKIKNPEEKAHVLPYLPVAAITELNFKDRDVLDFDFTRLNEELVRQNKIKNMTLVYPGTTDITKLTHLDRYSSLLITTYNYSDLEKATKILSDFAIEKHIYAVLSDSPLFMRLSELAKRNEYIHLYPRIGFSKVTKDPLQTQTIQMFAAIEKTLVPTIESTTTLPAVSFTETTPEKIELGMALQKKEIPVLLQTSYFPWWQRTDADQQIYLASPTNMLTYMNASSTLEFKTGTSVWIGYILSFLTIIGSIFLL
jgi:hypothetical protein